MTVPGKVRVRPYIRICLVGLMVDLLAFPPGMFAQQATPPPVDPAAIANQLQDAVVKGLFIDSGSQAQTSTSSPSISGTPIYNGGTLNYSAAPLGLGGNDAPVDVHNSGVMSQPDDAPSTVHITGSLYNESGGYYYVGAGSTTTVDGNVSNTGYSLSTGPSQIVLNGDSASGYGTMSVSAGNFQNDASVTLTGDGTFGGQLVLQSGNFTNNGGLNIGSFSNTAGGSVVNVQTGSFDNSSTGSVNMNGTGDSIRVAGQFTNEGGFNAYSSNSSFTSAGFSNNNGGSLYIGSNATLNIHSSLANDGSSEIQLYGGSVLNLKSMFAPKGMIGDKSSAGFDLNNSGSVTQNDGFVSTVSISGDLNNTGGGQYYVGSGGTTYVVGQVMNDSLSAITLNGSGSTGVGTLSVTNGVTNDGWIFLTSLDGAAGGNLQVGGDLTNNGRIHSYTGTNTVNVTGAIFNTATGIINLSGYGDVMTAGGQFQNAGSLTLSGQNTSVSGTGTQMAPVGIDNQKGGSITLSALGSGDPGAGGNVQAFGAFTNEGTITFQGAAGSVSSGDDFTNTGTVNMAGSGDSLSAGGAFNNSGNTSIGAGETLSVGTTYTQTAGETDVFGTLIGETNIDGGLITGGGTVVGNVTVDDGGTINPGDPQSFEIIGDFTLGMMGILDLDVAGISDPSMYDHVDATGNVTLNGTIKLTWLDGFLPVAGETLYDVVQWGSGSQFTGRLGSFMQNGLTFSEVIDGTNPNQLDLVISGAPEPSTLAMMFGAMMIAGGITWRSRRRRAGLASSGVE